MRPHRCVVLAATVLLLCSCAAGVAETTQAPDIGGGEPPGEAAEPPRTSAEPGGVHPGGKWVGSLRDVQERPAGVAVLTASRTLGVQGGVIELGREAELTIPRGALRGDQVITVTRVPTPATPILGRYVGHTYAIEPAGLAVRGYVTLNIHLAAEPPATLLGLWAGQRTAVWVGDREAFVQGNRLGEVSLFAPAPPDREPVLGWPDVLPPPE